MQREKQLEWSVNARSVAARRRSGQLSGARTRTGQSRRPPPRRRRGPDRDEELVRRWTTAIERSRERRTAARIRRRRQRRIAISIVTGGLAIGLGGTLVAPPLVTEGGSPAPAGSTAAQPAEAWRAVPAAAQVKEARRYAKGRAGTVSFAVIDEEGLRGFESNHRFVSASVVKAMLLAAELRRLRDSRERLEPSERATLDAMITVSDNDAADSVYYRVGDEGLNQVARLAGMKSFAVSGYWGNAETTAADQARFFYRLERNLVGPHRAFAHRLLAEITGDQRWGVFEGAPRGWRIQAKGGWRSTELGGLVHQAARMERGGARIGLAVLTDGQPSHDYGVETIAGVTRRLLRPPGGSPAR
jgi:beta-lactamase class A